MSEQELSPWDKEKSYNEKKLRKHEQKLKERLKEAQEEQTAALERLRRAEERMRKRMVEVEYLEERLNIVHQQMTALQSPHATVVTIITAGADALTPMIEAPSSPIEPTQANEEQPEVSPEEVVDTSSINSNETVVEEVVNTSSSISDENVMEEGDVDDTQATDEELEAHTLEYVADTHEVEVSLIEDIAEDSVNEGEMVMEVEVGELQVMDDPIAEVYVAELPVDKDQASPEVPVDDIVRRARKARAIADEAEAAARIAIERAVDLEEYLEQVGSARHLLQEIEHLQAEADRITMIAREAKEVALVAESLAGSIQEGQHRDNIMLSYDDEEAREEPILEMNTNDSTQSSEIVGHPSSLEVAKVEEIEEEEEALETVAAMIIADAAGIAAAQAEAEAEASSARTRESRAQALKADQALENVLAAIRMRKLSGEGAEVALRAAEREATHTHAVLADAEVAEERALSAAMNAEAEAEVAEGMAFATSSRDERDEKLRDENASL